MALETLKNVNKIGNFPVIVMDELRAKYPEARDNIGYSLLNTFSVELNKEYQLTVDCPGGSIVSSMVIIKLEAIGSFREKLNGLKRKEYNAALLLDASKSEDFTSANDILVIKRV